MGKFNFFFRDLDIFSQSFTYSLTSKKKEFQTKTGALFSLLFVVVLSLGAYFYISKYTDTTSPRVTIIKEAQNIYPKINLHSEQIIPGATLQSRANMLHVSELNKYLTGIITKFERKMNEKTGKVETLVKGTQKIVNAVETIAGEGNFEENISDSGASRYFTGGFIYSPEDMSDNEFWTIEGNEKSLPYSFITFTLYPCSLPDPTQCAPIESVIEYDYSFALTSLSYKIKEKKNPIFRLFEYDILSAALNPVAFTKNDIIMKKIRIMDEDTDFVKPRLNSEIHNVGKIESYSKFRSLGVYCSSASIQEGTCVPYTTITIKSGNEVHTVLRVYPKLFNSLSELGGFSDLITIFLSFVVYLFNRSQLEKFTLKSAVPSIESLGKYKRVQKEKMSEGEVEKKLLKEKMSSFDVMKTTTMFEGFCSALMDQSYEESLNLIPFIERISGNNQEKIDPEIAIEHVLKSEPKNQLEHSIKVKLELLINPNIIKECEEKEEPDHDFEMFNLDSPEIGKSKKSQNFQNKFKHRHPGVDQNQKIKLLHRKKVVKRRNMD